MSRPWVAAAIAACLIAFAASYAVARPDSQDRQASSHLKQLTLSPSAAPASWHRTRVPGSPAVLRYPSGWRQIPGDRGTASAALKVRDRIVGYLNATPQGGEETLANWLSFRPDHNAEEGDRNVTPIAGATGIRFRSGRASCLVDSYATGARYRELACIVAGRDATTVIVGSAVPSRWASLAPVLRRAVAGFTT
jgi:hypothetical protein